jgi:uncharacterized protein
MKVPGVVTNITAFGAFVDIGVHQDGLVHLSELADGFVKSPKDVVKVNSKVEVTVLAVDLERNRVSLSMKKFPGMKTDKPFPPVNRDGKGDDATRRLKPAEIRPARDAGKPFNNPFTDALSSPKKR